MSSKPINNIPSPTGNTDRPSTKTGGERTNPVRIAVTGGIGSGKSYVCRLLENAGYPVFYCDDEAKRIIRTDEEVRQALTLLIGHEVYAPNGNLTKPVLAAYLCAGRENATRVDAIVHPKVAQAFAEWAMAQTDAALVFMECALLFEAGFDRLTDITATVVVPEATRLKRLMQRDGISETKAREWIALQLPEAEKQRRADVCLRNDDGHLQEDIDNLLRMGLNKNFV